jgi:sugar lactone lactonase YvrE
MCRQVIRVFIGCLLLFSCRSTNVYFSHPYTKITTLPGPEDMVLDTLRGEAQIIIGCASRRKTEVFISGIQHYNIKKEKVETYTIKNFPDSMRFNPHGIDLGEYRGKKILWVINHEDEKKRQSILRFNILATELVLDTIFMDKSIISPNDICDGGKGTFYFTNDASSRNAGLELVLKIKGGSVIYYNGKTFQPFNKKFSYPNGIVKFKDQLFFSTSRQNKIFSIKLREDGSMVDDSVSLVTKGKSWDNFSVHGDHLICTSHTYPLKFLKHRNHEKHESPFQVYSVNPVTKTKGIVYHTDGESISAGSTAIYYKGNLFICQVFDPYILKVNLATY